MSSASNMSAHTLSHSSVPLATSSAPSYPYFDALLLTASNPRQADAFAEEIAIRRQRGTIPSEEYTRVIIVCDPAGVRIGSGGATVGALYQLYLSFSGSHVERLSQLASMRIGLFHSGGDSQRLPIASVRGKAFCGMTRREDVDECGIFESTPFDHLVTKLARLLQAPGCIVTATDCLYHLPRDYPVIRQGTPEASGVVGLTIETPAALGSNHGVFVLEESETIGIRPLFNILQKASQSTLSQVHAITSRHTVLLDSGIIFLPPTCVNGLIEFITQRVTPFYTCIDGMCAEDEQVFRFELYTDILLPLNPSLSHADYLASSPPDSNYPLELLHDARHKLWQLMQTMKGYGAVHPAAKFYHMGTILERMEYMFSQEEVYRQLREEHLFTLQSHVHWNIHQPSASSSPAAILHPSQCALLNSSFTDSSNGRLDSECLVEYSTLSRGFHVGARAIVSGVRSECIGASLHVPTEMCIQETRLNTSTSSSESSTSVSSHSRSAYSSVVSIFHTHDPIKTPFRQHAARLCGVTFTEFIKRLADSCAISEDELIHAIWPKVNSDATKTLWNAKLYPVLHHDTQRSTDSSHVMWLLRLSDRLSSDSNSVHVKWLQAKRLSLCDILAEADVVEENRWHQTLATRIDAWNLIQQLSTPHSPSLPSISSLASPLLTLTEFRTHPFILRLLNRRRASSYSVNENFMAIIDEHIIRQMNSPESFQVMANLLWLQFEVLNCVTSSATMPSSNHDSDSDVATLLNSLHKALSHTSIDMKVILPELIQLRRKSVSSATVVELYRLTYECVIRSSVSWVSESSAAVLSSYSHGNIASSSVDDIAVGDIVSLQGSVRLDLMGGWTDTPPVCWEHGGCVLNVALKIDDQYPIRLEASVQYASMNDPSVIIKFGRGEDGCEITSRIELNQIDDLRDFNQPTAPGALIKATLIAMGIVDLEHVTGFTLAQQLSHKYWSNRSQSDLHTRDSSLPSIQLRLRSWINLRGDVAFGTGLGISSILAADLVNLFGSIFPREGGYSPHHVAFLVLRIEELLTTCGGWQDQVGGLWDGFKLTRSRMVAIGGREEKQLSVIPLPISVDIVREFESHILFIHTGFPRLAKNLLRTVLDQWSTREPSIVQLFDRLEIGAVEMTAALYRRDWPQFGRLFAQFWEIKRTLATSKDPSAPPAEPKHVHELIQRTEKLCYGASLAGAGGGGFLVLCAPPSNHAPIRLILDEFNREHTDTNSFTECRLYKGTVCHQTGACWKMSLRKKTDPSAIHSALP